MYRLHLVVYSSTDGHLGSFYLLAIINSVLIQTLLCKHLFTILLLILLYIYPEVELLDHMAGLFENSGGMVMPFS